MKKLHLALFGLFGGALYLIGLAQGNGLSAAQYQGEPVVYVFSDCTRPVMPDRAIFARRDYAQSLSRYNALVEESNAYMRCIRNEAQRDIDGQTALIRSAYLDETALITRHLNDLRSQIERRGATMR